MQELCTLHGRTGVGDSGEYLPSDTDRQVGLGMLGLANLLRRYGVTYDQFGRALEQYNNGEIIRSPAFELVSQIASGVELAAGVARRNNMVRAFAIAPTASCSYRSKDLDGLLLLLRLHHLSAGRLTATAVRSVFKPITMAT